MFNEFAALIAAIDPKVALMIFVFSGLFWLLVKVVNDDNPLDWWQFISTKGSDGQHYGDIDKLGKVVGIVVSSVIMLMVTYASKMDAVLLGVYLAFVGGIAGYSAYLRVKQGLPPVATGSDKKENENENKTNSQ